MPETGQFSFGQVNGPWAVHVFTPQTECVPQESGFRMVCKNFLLFFLLVGENLELADFMIKNKTLPSPQRYLEQVATLPSLAPRGYISAASIHTSQPHVQWCVLAADHHGRKD